MVNIKTDFGAVGDGVTPDDAAFGSFNAWARTQTGTIYLMIPPGTYHFSALGSTRFMLGIKNLVVSAYGASLDKFNLAGGGILALATKTAAVQNVNAGTDTITLVNPSDATKFVVGNWVCITAFDMMGAGSFPPNPFFYEYRLINSINTETGVIVLDRELLNSYLSTYPQYDPGDAANYNQGGPATLYLMNPDWDVNVIFYGLNFSYNQEIDGGVRSVNWIDCRFDGGACPAPSTGSILFRNCQFSQASTGPNTAVAMQVDKLIPLIQLDSIFLRILQFPSSIEKAVLRNSTIRQIQGTPKHLTIEDCDIAKLNLGSTQFGASISFTMTNSRVNQLTIPAVAPTSFIPVTAIVNGRIIWNKFRNGSTFNGRTYGGGTFGTGLIDKGAIIGKKYFLSAGQGIGTSNALPFVVTNVSDDGTLEATTQGFIDTTLPTAINIPQGSASGVPGITNGTPGWYMVPHPCPNVVVNASIGCQDVLNMSHQTDGLPLGSYARYLLTGNFGSAPPSILWGNLIKLRINVKRAYTGALSTLIFHPFRQFGTAILPNENGSPQSAYDPQINLKIAGERIITPGSTIGTQTGDANLTTAGLWILNGIIPFLSGNISSDNQSAWPIIDMEVFTDQGIIANNNIMVGTRNLSF